MHTVIAQAKNPAIKGCTGGRRSASNKLAVKVAADSVRFFVNDVEVGAVDGKNGMASAGGIYGFRVNHGISVHIAGLAKQ